MSPSGFELYAKIAANPRWYQDFHGDHDPTTGSNYLQKGQQESIAIFFKHAALSGGRAKLWCDITATSGGKTHTESSGVCFDGVPGYAPFRPVDLRIQVFGDGANQPPTTFHIALIDLIAKERLAVNLEVLDGPDRVP